VERGCYGTRPRAFSGQVFAAVHAEVTKFHGWFYNFSTFCPQDRRGRTAGEVWAESYARIFQPGGTSAHFDALQLDTLVEDVWPGRGSDINNNGIDDRDEDFGGVNWFAVGVCRALESLRAQLPPDKLLLPDAGNRGFAFVNGWEVEGFPGRHDPAWRKYSEVCNRLELSRHVCREPRFTKVQHKIFNYTLSRDGTPQILAGQELPFHHSRAVMGLAEAEQRASVRDRQPLRRDDGGHRRRGGPGRLRWFARSPSGIGETPCLAPNSPTTTSTSAGQCGASVASVTEYSESLSACHNHAIRYSHKKHKMHKPTHFNFACPLVPFVPYAAIPASLHSPSSDPNARQNSPTKP